MEQGQTWIITGTLQHKPKELPSDYGTIVGYIEFPIKKGTTARKYKASGDIADEILNWDIDQRITLIGFHDYETDFQGNRIDKMVVQKIANPSL